MLTGTQLSCPRPSHVSDIQTREARSFQLNSRVLFSRRSLYHVDHCVAFADSNESTGQPGSRQDRHARIPAD